MTQHLTLLTLFVWSSFVTIGVAESNIVQPADVMPHVEDYTQMWWADGFPSHTPAAPWLRVIQTGNYAFALNTETLKIPHFGAIAESAGYDQAVLGDNRGWEKLPPAQLDLSISKDGKTYRCTAGGKWSRFGGPRLIESGRFFQRADVTDLTFTADDGSALDVEARFETAAFSDRLTLILSARPKLDEKWENAGMEISFSTKKGVLQQRWHYRAINRGRMASGTASLCRSKPPSNTSSCHNSPQTTTDPTPPCGLL